jgi:hypothetical protein
MNPFARLARVARIGTLVTLALAVPVIADAAVRKEGAWPAADKRVTFDFDGKPSDGLKKLASEAGWSLVVSKGINAGEHDVKIDVDDQPADAVLEALFAESSVVARRNGTLITITPGSADDAGATPPAPGDVAATPPPTPPTPPTAAAEDTPAVPSVPPVPTVRGQDRNVFGDSLIIGRDEIVHTITVTGGSANIYGTVTGDLVVAGGSAKIHDGGRVVGNATVFGGSLKVEKGGRVDGDVGIVGGALKREEGAIIGGKIVDGSKDHPGNTRVSVTDGDVSTEVEAAPGKHSGRSRLSQAAHSFGQSMTNMALLFVFGCVALALGTRKMETLRVEVAARPMKSFALGIVSALAGGIALLAMCITVVGIPFALLAATLAILSVYASMAAVLTTIGAAVAGHKSQSPYVHLLVGCAGLLLVGVIPWVGGLVTAAVVLVAIGALVSTRLAGAVTGPTKKADLV